MSSKIPKELIAELFDLAKEHDLVELAVTLPEGKFRIRRAGKYHIEHVPMEVPSRIEEKESAQSSREGMIQVCAPLMGIFYRAPGPGLDPFVSLGERVEIGDTLCIIEAMKVMNEITCEVAGKVAEIIPKNGEVVEEGAILFFLEPEEPA